MNKMFVVYYKKNGSPLLPICVKDTLPEAEEALLRDAKGQDLISSRSVYRTWGDVFSEEGKTYDLGSWSDFYIIKAEEVSTEVEDEGKDDEDEYDNDLLSLCASFSSFRDLFNRVQLGNLVLRYWYDEEIPVFKVIVGCTELPNDILLHVVDADGHETNKEAVDCALKRYGIQIVRLSEILTMEPTFISEDIV